MYTALHLLGLFTRPRGGCYSDGIRYQQAQGQYNSNLSNKRRDCIHSSIATTRSSPSKQILLPIHFPRIFETNVSRKANRHRLQLVHPARGRCEAGPVPEAAQVTRSVLSDPVRSCATGVGPPRSVRTYKQQKREP